MKNKLYILLVVVLTAIMVTPTPALAYWSNVSGTVRNSKTYAPWAYGGSVTVWDCSNIGGTPLGGPQAFADGTFSVAVSGPPADPPGYLCVEITFNDPDGPGGYDPPKTKWLVFPSTGVTDQGNYDTGNTYTDAGPNAVALTDANVQSPNVWLPVALAALAVIVVGGAVLLLRRRRAA